MNPRLTAIIGGHKHGPTTAQVVRHQVSTNDFYCHRRTRERLTGLCSGALFTRRSTHRLKIDRGRGVRKGRPARVDARRPRLGRRTFLSRLGSHILPSHPRDVHVPGPRSVHPCARLVRAGLSNVSTLFFVSGGPLAGQVQGPPRFSGPNCRVQLFNYRV